MKTSDFYFDLPEELIAQEPLKDRASSRLMVVHKDSGEREHRHFRDIKEYLKAGDCLVINNTKVLPARLYGERVGTGAAMEILLLVRRDMDTWEVLVRPGKKAKPGDKISFGGGKLIAVHDLVHQQEFRDEVQLGTVSLQQLLGLGNVVLVRNEALVEAVDVLGQRAGERLGGVGVGNLHDGFLVGGVVDRLTHAHIVERSNSFKDILLKRFHCIVVFLNGIPFVYNNNNTFLVSLNQVVDSHILSLNTSLCINHKNTYI